MSPLLRYVLFQLPAIGVVSVLAYILHDLAGVSLGWCATGVALWVAKDVAMYPVVRESYHTDAPTGVAALVGREGVAVERLQGGGYVRIGAERWRVRCEDGARAIDAGRRVAVVDVIDGTPVVRAEENSSA